MDNRALQDAVRHTLKTPGARIIARKLREAAKGTLRKYDRCTPEELVRLQMLRALLNDELPRIIESLANPPQESKKWDWRRFLGI